MNKEELEKKDQKLATMKAQIATMQAKLAEYEKEKSDAKLSESKEPVKRPITESPTGDNTPTGLEQPTLAPYRG